MRILIPYDGTKNAENALLELHNAEFGKDDEILVIITDVLLAESLDEISQTRRKRRLDFESTGTSSYSPSRSKFEEERFLVNKIQSRLLSEFPELNIKTGTLPGYSLVSSELLDKARRWKADLIILGKQKHEVEAAKNGYKPEFWRIVSEAQSPVRFAYGTKHENFKIKPNYSFVADKENLNGKQKSKVQKASTYVAGMIRQQEKNSVQVAPSNELFEQNTNPKLRRLYKPKRRIQKLATASPVAI